MNARSRGNVFLLLAAAVWGCGLIAQKAGMSYLGPLAFTAIRCTLGGVSMLPLIYILQKKKPSDKREGEPSEKQNLKGAFACSIPLLTLIMFQQYGLPHTTAGKAGFITALYILITPVMGMFLGKKINKKLWIAVAVGLGGMYLMCLYTGLDSVNFGDVMMLFAAIACAAHLHVIDHFVAKCDPVKMSCYQFIMVGVMCIIPAIILEETSWQAVSDCLIPILYAGIFSCAVGYTLQIVGQKYTDPSVASLLLSTETVFTLLAGMVFFHEVLAIHEYIGCAMMFIAIIISQLPDSKTK